MDEERNLNMDFGRMTIADVEAILRRKASGAEIQNKWVAISFGNVVVKIRRW